MFFADWKPYFLDPACAGVNSYPNDLSWSFPLKGTAGNATDHRPYDITNATYSTRVFSNTPYGLGAPWSEFMEIVDTMPKPPPEPAAWP
jgi:hypothetical protein